MPHASCMAWQVLTWNVSSFLIDLSLRALMSSSDSVLLDYLAVNHTVLAAACFRGHGQEEEAHAFEAD